MKMTHWCLSLLAISGCGDGALQTEFGRLKSVERYRDDLEMIIVEANAIEQELWERAVGSTGRATGQNLAPVYQELKPRLVALIVDLDKIAVPQKLLKTHGELRSALGLRLEASDLVIAGWTTEQQQGYDEAQPLYADAEKKVDEANALLAAVSEVLLEVDIALAEEEGRTLVGQRGWIGRLVSVLPPSGAELRREGSTGQQCARRA